MFRMLVSQYVILDSVVGDRGDESEREVSRKEEAEFFSPYMQGAERFREQDYEVALSIFSELRSSAAPRRSWLDRLFGQSGYSWVREASSYMVARCQLIIAQKNWDGYRSSASYVDQEMLRSADSSYIRYLGEYPDGIYARSARDIRRKIYFLSDRQPLLNQELKRVMSEHFPSSGSLTPPASMYKGLVDEFLYHFHSEVDFANDSPILVGYAWLGPQNPRPQDLIALESREEEFTAYPGLFRYVRALGLYRLGRFKELLEKTPEEPAVKSTLWLSTQLLRVRSLEATGDLNGASAAVARMHTVSPEDAVDLEMAALKLNNGEGIFVFHNESLIVNSNNLRAFATFGLTDSELETGIAVSVITGNNRQTLVEELARRYVLSSRFAELAHLLEKEELAMLSPAKKIVADLASNPRNVDALVELGEFLYDNRINPSRMLFGDEGHSWIGYPLRDLSRRCEPCSKFEKRAASYTSPMTLFQTAVRISQESGQRSESEAKALHYIVLAGRPGHWQSQCAWNASPSTDTLKVHGKAAFTRLHKLYEDSPWAKATPYYYE